MADPCLIRLTSPADLPALAALERLAFTDPWTAAQLDAALGGPGGIGWVATRPAEPTEIVGHLIGRVIVDHGEILSVAVTPASQRLGIGAALLDQALSTMRGRGVAAVWLEVRAGNHGAQALYRGRGFEPRGRRRGYYQSPLEDALIFGLDLQGCAS